MRTKHLVALLAAALSIPLVSTAQNPHWNSVAIGGGGFVTGVVPSKLERDVVYVRTDVGGACRWDAAKSRWGSMACWMARAMSACLVSNRPWSTRTTPQGAPTGSPARLPINGSYS